MSCVMASDSEQPARSRLATDEGYSLSMPMVGWTFGSVALPESKRLMDMAFKRWYMARRYGFYLQELLYLGKPLSQREIDRCNLWIDAGGAAEGSKLKHWDAVRLFERVIGAHAKASGLSGR
jgi:hypothetical protein